MTSTNNNDDSSSYHGECTFHYTIYISLSQFLLTNKMIKYIYEQIKEVMRLFFLIRVKIGMMVSACIDKQ